MRADWTTIAAEATGGSDSTVHLIVHLIVRVRFRVELSLSLLGSADCMVVPTGVQVVLEPVSTHSLTTMANKEEATCCTAKDDDDEGQDREGDC